MQGSIQPMIQLYDNNERVLLIPVYQRNYDWKREHCARLFDDLVDTMRENRPNHFFGSIVYAPESMGVFTIIDGQQRLTSVNLLFLALWRSIKEGSVEVEGNPDALAEQIFDTYLRSKFATEGFSQRKLKLKPVKADQQAYELLFDAEEHFDETSNITANFRYFMNRIARRELTAEGLFQAIRRLEVMRLKLGRDDDAQLIFESLNSTGLELSEADMIRNYVLMGQESQRQERLYEQYWNPVEELVNYETSDFVRAYLTAQLGRVPRMNNVYSEFKAFHRKHVSDIEKLLADLLEFAHHQHNLATATTGVTRVDRLLRRFNLLDRTVAMPFLMLVLRDFRSGALSEPDLFRAITIVDTYLTRRWVCGYPTNSLSKIFALLHREVLKQQGQDDAFIDVLVYQLLHRTGAGTFPRDDEFAKALDVNDFYNIYGTWRNYWWESLENGDSNDIRDIASALARGDLSVEHIMPQNPKPEWFKEMGADAERIHETWLHRLGNLTVTGYNSSYSNRPFLEKRNHPEGFAASPYRLNALLRTAEVWGEEQMADRTRALRDRALEIWPQPSTRFQPAPEARDVEALGEDTSFTNRRIKGWEYQGDEHRASTWKDMLIAVVRMLVETHRAELFALASSPRDLGLRRVTDQEPLDDYHTEVAPGVSVWTESATSSKVWVLRAIFDALDLDKDELVFQLHPQAVSDQ